MFLLRNEFVIKITMNYEMPTGHKIIFLITVSPLTSKATLLHVLFCASYVGFGGTAKEHVLGIPRLVLHNKGLLSTTSKRSGVPAEEFELLVEMDVLLSRTAGFCRLKTYKIIKG